MITGMGQDSLLNNGFLMPTRTQTIDPGLRGGLNPGTRPVKRDSDGCPEGIWRTLRGSESGIQSHTYVGGLNPDRVQPCPWPGSGTVNDEVFS